MTTRRRPITRSEWRWTLILGLIVMALTAVPYLIAWSHETPERAFSGCILLVEDCYSYLAKMRQGADGAWLFHIPYTPESHPGTLFLLFHLVLGKIAKLLPGGDLTSSMVLVYHVARVIFGLGLLLTLYRFLAALARSVRIRRLAWLMVALGGGLGWLLAALGKIRWLGDMPLDLYFAEGFGFIALFGFPHVAAAQSLLLGGMLCLLRAWDASAAFDGESGLSNPCPDRGLRHTSIQWAALTGLAWLLMGLIVPFYVAIAWAVTGAFWIVLCLRQGAAFSMRWREALMAGLAALLSAPVVIYSAWVFTSDPVYAAWAAQNQISSPHPLHYLAAYGIPLVLAAFAARESWRDEGWTWTALAWVAVMPLLVYLPVNVQLRLATSVQVPLSLLAARGAVRLWQGGRRWLTLLLLTPMVATSVFVLASSSAWMISRPSPSFRDIAEVTAMNWLSGQARPDDVVLTAYDTGAYLPARVTSRVMVGHDLETMNPEKKKELVNRFFDASSDEGWRQRFLTDYGVDYVFWGPAEKDLGQFDPDTASYLRRVYEAGAYTVFAVGR